LPDARRVFLRGLLQDAGEIAADRALNILAKVGIKHEDEEDAGPRHLDQLDVTRITSFAAETELGEEYFDRPYFRPPGAMAEAEFLDTCSRCRKCVDACPEYCIVPAQSARMGAPEGTPLLFPNESACTMCGECMHVCPTGALVPIPEEFIRIGVARISPITCIAHGEDHCTACHDACPVVPNAVTFPGGIVGSSPEVNRDTCTGCGLCVSPCPTEPKSIVVMLRGVDADQLDEE